MDRRKFIAGSLGVAAAALPVATPAANTPHRFTLGQFDLRVIDDGHYTAPASFIAVNAPPQEFAEALGQVGQSVDAYTTTINNLLVDTGDHLVLIDTGFGAFAPTTGNLLPALEAEAIAPDDIDTVVITHMHGDHFAGAVDAAGKPVFPNARYIINRAEYEFWWAEPSLAELPIPDDFKTLFREWAKGTLVALQGKLAQVEPGTEVVPGVRVIAAYGHTPGHLAVEVASGGETLLHVVDAAADPVLHLQHPDWFFAPDNWPAQELMTRRQLFDRAATEDLLVLAYHIAFPGLGHVSPDGDGWLWEPVA